MTGSTGSCSRVLNELHIKAVKSWGDYVSRKTGRLRRVADSELTQNLVDNTGHRQRFFLGELVALFLACSDRIRLMPLAQFTSRASGTADGANCMYISALRDSGNAPVPAPDTKNPRSPGS